MVIIVFKSNLNDGENMFPHKNTNIKSRLSDYLCFHLAEMFCLTSFKPHPVEAPSI